MQKRHLVALTVISTIRFMRCLLFRILKVYTRNYFRALIFHTHNSLTTTRQTAKIKLN